jgi:hypothetical protein
MYLTSLLQKKNGIDARVMVKNLGTGKLTAVPSIVLLATGAGYLMRCPHLSADTSIRLVVALVEIKSEQHPEWAKLPKEQQVLIKDNVFTITTKSAVQNIGWATEMEISMRRERVLNG